MTRLFLIPLLAIGFLGLAQEANAQVPVTDEQVQQQRTDLDERVERIDQRFHGVERHIEQQEDPMQRQAHEQRLDELRTQYGELQRDIRALDDVQVDLWTDRYTPVNERLVEFERDFADWTGRIGFHDREPR